MPDFFVYIIIIIIIEKVKGENKIFTIINRIKGNK